jgi:hypothetical protein
MNVKLNVITKKYERISYRLLCLRIRLVCWNSYYTVIGIGITRNRISCNGIAITIHQFRLLKLYFLTAFTKYAKFVHSAIIKTTIF